MSRTNMAEREKREGEKWDMWIRGRGDLSYRERTERRREAEGTDCER